MRGACGAPRYANNRYAGHAPAMVRLFQELWTREHGNSGSKM
jgi:hypothetical protein